MKRVSELIGKYMAWIVLAIAALALFLPGTCLWIQTKWVNYLLMVVMFGMGLTMKLSDFAVVFSRPRDVLIGCTAQFVVMPLLAFALGKFFGLGEMNCLSAWSLSEHVPEAPPAMSLPICRKVIQRCLWG